MCGGLRGAAPGLSVAGHGIGGDQKLAHDGDERDLAGSAVLVDEPVVELLERGGMADRGPRSVEQGSAHPGPAMAGGFAITGFAAFFGVRRQADERGDLLAAKQPELGQIGDQRRRRHRADAKNGLQQRAQLGAVRIGRNRCGKLAFDGFKAVVQHRDDSVQAGAHGTHCRQRQAAAFGVRAASAS